jgi:hypothetical protein
MSDKIAAEKVSLDEIKCLFQDLYTKIAVESSNLTIINNDGLAIEIYIDRDNNVVRFFSAVKVARLLTELELAQLCKKYNDQDRITCCFLNYDIRIESNSNLIGFSIDLAFSRGLSMTHLFDTINEYEYSCAIVLREFVEDGIVNPKNF